MWLWGYAYPSGTNQSGIIQNDKCSHSESKIFLCSAADSLPCPWLPVDLHSEAAYAVVQTLGRFMASYFTNQPLYILPPHHVAVLPPLHLPQGEFL